MKILDRRELIKRFGAAGFLAWSAMNFRRAEAQAGQKLAKRFLFMHVPNGLAPVYAPGGDGANFTFSDILSPLTPFRNDLIISKLSTVKSTGHPNVSCILTGNRELGLGVYGNGPSINHIVAQKIGSKDPIGMLNLWVSKNERQSMRNTLTYDGNSNFIAPERNAAAAYKLLASRILCSGVTQPPAMVDAVFLKQKSIMDVLKDDLKDANRLLGLNADERKILESHQESLVSIESRLSSMDKAAGQGADLDTSKICAAGGLAESVKKRSENAGMTIPELSRFMIDLSVLAFATELTHSATLFYWSEGGTCATNGDFLSYMNQKISVNLHELSHSYGNGGEPPAIANAKEKWNTVLKWSVSEFA